MKHREHPTFSTQPQKEEDESAELDKGLSFNLNDHYWCDMMVYNACDDIGNQVSVICIVQNVSQQVLK